MRNNAVEVFIFRRYNAHYIFHGSYYTRDLDLYGHSGYGFVLYHVKMSLKSGRLVIKLIGPAGQQ